MPGSVAPLDVAGVTIPHHFRCPISLELMRDPVTVCTGQTYDRPSIESWVATGNTTCPVTRVPLADFTLIPNHTLRRLIQDWCVAHRSHGVEHIPTPKQPADPPLVRSLIASASSGSVATVELLCRWEGGREAVVEGWGGGEAAVASLVRAMAGKASGRAAEHAAGALVAVLGNSEALQREAVAAGVVSHLLLLVQGGCSERAKITRLRRQLRRLPPAILKKERNIQ